MAVNRAKQRMLEGKPAIGGEVGLGSPLAAELISPLGFDFVLVDNQHGFWGNRARCMPSGPSVWVRPYPWPGYGGTTSDSSAGSWTWDAWE